jgi:hypothetical protein
MDRKLNSIETAKMRLLWKIEHFDFPLYGDEYQTASQDACISGEKQNIHTQIH